MVEQVLLVVVASLVLFKSADILVVVLARVARFSNLEKFGLTALVIALSTSLPELVVSIVSASKGNSILALGAILGSNIANVSLVIGGAAALGGGIGVVGSFIRRDVFVAFLAAALPLLMLLDGSLSRLEGVGLIVVYLIYSGRILRGEEEYTRRRSLHQGHRLLKRMAAAEAEKDTKWLVAGVVMLVVSGKFLVDSMERITVMLGLPVFLGGLMLAIGTTLPELSFELEAIRKKEAGMVYGNLLGSIVANATLILGLAVVIHPIELTAYGVEGYLMATLTFVVAFAVFWWLARSKNKLSRWEGMVLVGLYLGFLVVEKLIGN